jgi:hypothetical protein
VYPSPTINGMLKSRKMKCAGRETPTKEIRNAYSSLLGRTEGKKETGWKGFSVFRLLKMGTGGWLLWTR